MTPRQIHDLGLAEVARIGAQMDASVAASGFKGKREQFQKFLTTDPQFFFTKPQDMLAGYRDIAKRVDAALPALFAELPRQTYGIRAMPPRGGDPDLSDTEIARTVAYMANSAGASFKAPEPAAAAAAGTRYLARLETG